MWACVSAREAARWAVAYRSSGVAPWYVLQADVIVVAESSIAIKSLGCCR